MSKTTIQVDADCGEKLREIKKKLRLPVGLLATIGLDFVTAGIQGGQLMVSNGRIVPAPEKKAA